MGQARQKKTTLKQSAKQALEHFKVLGTSWSPTAEAWLQEHFVRTLSDAALQGEACWQNQVYLEALKDPDEATRRGVRAVMNNVFTAGVQAGRTVFGLVADVKLPRREVVGEFDHCHPLEAWVASRLGVERSAVYMRHSSLFAPAHAGLFCITTTLMQIAAPRPPGFKPTARTRTVEDDSFRRQSLLFLASVETSGDLDLGRLADQDFACELPYWGPDEITPGSVATVRPIEPVLAFDGVELLSFRVPLANAALVLGPWRDLDKPQTLAVRLDKAENSRRFLQEAAVVGRLLETDMPEKLLYQGPDTPFFLAHLERLGVSVQRS